jgi:hypothetical protein
LLNAKVGIDRGIPRCAGQLLVVSVGDMLTSFGVTVTLGEAEVNHMDDVMRLLLGDPDEEVIRLYISMDEVIVVKKLDSLEELVCYHKYRLQRELPLALSEQVF